MAISVNLYLTIYWPKGVDLDTFYCRELRIGQWDIGNMDEVHSTRNLYAIPKNFKVSCKIKASENHSQRGDRTRTQIFLLDEENSSQQYIEWFNLRGFLFKHQHTSEGFEFYLPGNVSDEIMDQILGKEVSLIDPFITLEYH